MAIGRQLKDVTSDINVTPMVDVMLVLLIIFMVITPMLQKGVPVDLVKAYNPRNIPDADKEDAVTVAVSRDGRIFLNSDQVALEEIAANVRDLISVRVDKTVYIKSDARAKYDTVVKAIDEVRSAGVDQLGLLTDRIEERARRMAL
jgi:biopolymer transport protein ExbD/biopolymer transport protein TolR